MKPRTKTFKDPSEGQASHSALPEEKYMLVRRFMLNRG